MSDDPIPGVVEAEAELRAKFGEAAVEILRLRGRDLAAFDEIRRLRAQLQQTAEFAFTSRQDAIELWRTEVEHLRARILELEANSAVILGTLATTAQDEPPRVFVRNVPPNAPPHDE